MRIGRTWVFLALLVSGGMLWLAGTVELFPQPTLCVAILLCGGPAAVAGAFLLLTDRPSGRREHGPRESAGFCLSCGVGAASIGLALSPLSGWLLPGMIFAAGGVALIAWAPQALVPRSAPG